MVKDVSSYANRRVNQSAVKHASPMIPEVQVENTMPEHPVPSTESSIHLSRADEFSGPQSPRSLVSSYSILAHSDAVKRNR